MADWKIQSWDEVVITDRKTDEEISIDQAEAMLNEHSQLMDLARAADKMATITAAEAFEMILRKLEVSDA